jgi:outer membrane protein
MSASPSVLAKVLGSLILLMMAIGPARAVDPFHTQRAVPVNPASALISGTSCTFGAPSSPLGLPEVIERALCSNPDTRNAWTIIEERAAAVGSSKAAYLPTLSAKGHWVHENTLTDVRDHPSLSSDYSSVVHSEDLSLSWVIYDFGGRGAALASAEALLDAAQASENAVLQDAFSKTAKTYYDAQSAHELLRTDAAIVADAQSSLTAAQARVAGGAAPNTELYQAQTAYAEAQIAQTRDRGRALSADGALADAIALAPNTVLDIEEPVDPEHPETSFSSALASLMAQAEHTHPAILAAEMELRAAEAGVTQAKAEGRPTISFVGDYSRNNEPVQMGLGFPHYPATGHDGYVGIEVSIPIFSGFTTTYRVRQAEAQVDQESSALDKAKRQVALQVWMSYQALQADTQNLTASGELQAVATKAWESSQRRYRSGAGTLLELLDTQRALAKARQQRLEASLAWRYDRLALASALGRLSIGSIDNR